MGGDDEEGADETAGDLSLPVPKKKNAKRDRSDDDERTDRASKKANKEKKSKKKKKKKKDKKKKKEKKKTRTKTDDDNDDSDREDDKNNDDDKKPAVHESKEKDDKDLEHEESSREDPATTAAAESSPDAPTSSSDDDDDDDDDEVSVSLDDLKRKILGRDLHPSTPLKEDGADHDLAQIRQLFRAEPADETRAPKASSIGERLQAELQCPICQDLLYPPVALPCGHSFCQDCLGWWWKTSTSSSSSSNTCPTCRARFPSFSSQSTHHGVATPGVNLALKKVMVALYGPKLVPKIRSLQKATRGEAGGAHDKGYEILSPLGDEFWHTLPTTQGYAGVEGSGGFVKVRRSIVLDAQDQRMQLALGLHRKPHRLENGLRVALVLLTMEEDEASDSGFPVLLQNAEDEHFVCTNEDRFRLGGGLSVEAGGAPVGRVCTVSSDATLEFTLDAGTCPNRSIAEARTLRFRHEETGALLELDLALLQKGASGNPIVTREQRGASRGSGMVLDDIGGPRYDDEEEEEEADLDVFERDGFLVDDEASEAGGRFSGEEAEFSGEDDDDACCVCGDGGELMVCDGGREMEGCGRPFHAACVGRSAIPEGDWICRECARSGGIEVGDEGHEFKPKRTKRLFSESGDEGDEPRAVAQGKTGRTLQDDDDDDDDDDDGEAELQLGTDSDDEEDDKPAAPKPTSSSAGARPNKRRLVLEDSDSD